MINTAKAVPVVGIILNTKPVIILITLTGQRSLIPGNEKDKYRRQWYSFGFLPLMRLFPHITVFRRMQELPIKYPDKRMLC
jgi:hypothetical protein